MGRLWGGAWIVALCVVGPGLMGCDDDGGEGQTDAADAGGATTDGGFEPDACADCGPPCPSEVPEGTVCVPPGEFWMGSPPDEPRRDADDEDYHLVRLTQPIFVRSTEVTQAEWAELMGNNPSWFGDGGPGQCRGDICDRRPVERVNWFEAVAWMNARSAADGLGACYTMDSCAGTPGEGCEQDGAPEPNCADGCECGAGYRCQNVQLVADCEGWRLPTEAEWEYFTRAGSAEARPADLDDIAWHRTTARGSTHQVATKDPNAFGVHDVLGNVSEWVNDLYGMDYGFFGPAAEAEVDPMGPQFGDTRVVRGCAWTSGTIFCRAGNRDPLQPIKRNYALGFRAVRTAR